MKNIRKILFIGGPLGFGALAVCAATLAAQGKPDPRGGGTTGSILTKTRPNGIDAWTTNVLMPIERSASANDHRTALRLIDANLGGPNVGLLRKLRARELVRTGRYEEAITEYRRLLAGEYGLVDLSVRELSEPFVWSLDHGRPEAARALADAIIARPTIRLAGCPRLDLASQPDSPPARLAHALAYAAEVSEHDGDRSVRVALLERATRIAPGDVATQVQLTFAYHARNAPGDRKAADRVFRRVNAQLPPSSLARRDLRVLAADFGVSLGGPNATTSLDADVRAVLMECKAREMKARQAKELARLNYRRSRGMAPGE